MSEAKFINGPYAAAKYSKRKIGIGRSGEGAFAFITPRQGDDFDEGLLYSIQLMKCAPEMYAMLESGIGQFSGTLWARKVSELLKKARGER